MGVIAGVHDGTANGGTPTHVTLTTGLTDLDVLVIDVTNLADAGLAVGADDANLAGRHTDLGISALLSHQLSIGTSGANQLSALAGMHLDVVDNGTNGDVGQRQAVAGLDVGGGGGQNLVTSGQTHGSDESVARAFGLYYGFGKGMALWLDYIFLIRISAIIANKGCCTAIVTVGLGLDLAYI